MKPKRLFREHAAASEALALDPSAFGLMFMCGGGTENQAMGNGVTVVTIDGPLAHKPGWWVSYDAISERMASAFEDQETTAIVMRIDSPGGECAGLFETVRTLLERKAASGKPVYAYVDEGAYSAAYALATVADEIYLPEAGGVGSIGVISMAVDMTARDKAEGLKFSVITSGKRKSDGNPHVPVSSEAIARDQARVDQLAAMFFAAVSDARGLSPKKIAALEANTFYGEDAIACGLADGVMSFDDVVRTAGNPNVDIDEPATSSVKTKDTPDRPVGRENSKMMGLLALTKAVNDARAAVDAATSPANKTAARKVLVAAEAALQAAESGVAAKVKKVKVTDKTVHTEETDDGDEDEDDDDSGDDDDDDAEDDDASDDAEDDAAEDEDGKKGKKGARAGESLLAMCKRITGKATRAEIAGALEGIAGASKAQSKSSARLAALEAESEAGKIDALISRGKLAGQIKPGKEKSIRAEAAKFGRRAPQWLAGFLDHAAVAVTGEHKEGKVASVDGKLDKPTKEMISIWKKMGITEAEYPAALESFNRANAAQNEAAQ